MSTTEPVQVFVRNEKGDVWGPLEPDMVGALIDVGTIKGGKLQVSFDGDNYVLPGQAPNVRHAFPRHTWGDVIVEGDDLPPGTATAPAAAAAPAPSAPIAGPGAKPVSGGVPMAGPGAMKNAQVRRSPTDSGIHRALVDRRTHDLGTPVVVSMDGVPGDGPQVINMGAAAGDGPQVVNMSAAEPKVAVALGDEPLEMPESGDLAQYSPVRLYYLAASSNLTGLLSLTLADRTLGIHFRKGNPEHLSSSHATDALGTYLVAQRLLTEAKLAEATQKAPQFGGELTAALFALGILNPGTAVSHLVQHAQGLLFKALIAEHGTFTYETKELPAGKAMPLGHRWAMLSDAVRRFPASDMRRRLGDAFELPIMKATGQVPVSDLRLIAQETRALGMFDGVRSLSQLVTDMPQETDHLVRTAFLLKEVDAVSFAAVRLKPASPSGVHRIAPAVGAAPPTSEPAKAPKVAPAAASPRAAPAGAGVKPAAVPAAPPVVKAPVEVDVVVETAVATPQAEGAPVSAASTDGEGVAEPVAATVWTPSTPGELPPWMPPAPGEGGTAPMGVVLGGPSEPEPAAPPPPVKPAAASPKVAPAAKPTAPSKPAAPAKPAGPAKAAAPAKPAAPAKGAPAAKPASGPKAPTPPPAPVDLQAELNQVVAFALAMADQNHFEVLGLKENATPSEVKLAYFKLAKVYHPDTVPPGAPEGLAKAKADVFARIGEANRVLSDDKQRAEYLEEVKAGGAGEKVDVGALLGAEESFQKGMILVKSRKFPEALKYLDEAIAANANEGEYYAWRGYAKFFVNSDKSAGQAEALKDIQMCTKMNPRVASAFYFQGHIAKLMGDLVAAKNHFKHCLELSPAHLDAQREMRLLK